MFIGAGTSSFTSRGLDMREYLMEMRDFVVSSGVVVGVEAGTAESTLFDRNYNPTSRRKRFYQSGR